MSTDAYVPSPPPGYRYHDYLFADLYAKQDASDAGELWLLAWGNMVALIPLGFGVLLLWLPYQLYVAMGTPLALLPQATWPRTVGVLATLALVVLMMSAHEGLHGLALWLAGHVPVVRLYVVWGMTGLRQGDTIQRREYLWMSLMPLVALTLLGGAGLLLLPPQVGRALLFALLVNTAASVGDLLVAARVWRLPAGALFTDDRGIRVFLPLADRSAAVRVRTSPTGPDAP